MTSTWDAFPEQRYQMTTNCTTHPCTFTDIDIVSGWNIIVRAMFFFFFFRNFIVKPFRTSTQSRIISPDPTIALNVSLINDKYTRVLHEHKCIIRVPTVGKHKICPQSLELIFIYFLSSHRTLVYT